MTEKVLSYDRAIVAQETGYNCGPAATQIVLDAAGIKVAESTLAREIGTTVNGTDYIGLIERSLDTRIPTARYTSVYLERDPISAAQKETLWRDLVRSIEGGYGVVMNWVAPPGNKPRGVKGSISPEYSGGTTYHYVAAMGYDDTPGGARAVWIADSGFRPFGYWISFDQCATLIPPKGYCYAAAPVQVPAATPPTDPVDVLSQAMGGAVSRDRYAALLPAVSACLRDCQATSMERIAMWCAQIGHESGGLRWMEEIADGSAYEGRQDLGNTHPGDGRRYKGRGPIQVTGRSNYARLSQWAYAQKLIPSIEFFTAFPEQLASDRYGFLGVTWYWTAARDMNAFADRSDIVGATRAVNGGTNGLADRTERWNRCRALGNRLLTLTTTGDDMAQVPQEQWDRVYRELTQRLPSRSIYRTPGEGPVDTVSGMVLNLDAMTHSDFIERLARLGDPDAIARIARVAAGQGAVTDQWAVDHAAKVLANIPEQFLSNYLAGAQK